MLKIILFLAKTFFVVLILTSCDRFDARLKIHNKSGKTIFVITSETENPSRYNGVEYYKLRNIPPDSSDTKLLINITWEDYINNSFNKKLNLYVFDLDTLLKYENIDSTLKHPIYKFEIPLKELEEKDWNITVVNSNNN
jgi:hypothetical protein